ncbi:SDR family NAD(P)-dependent oxidoreductase [Sphingomonas sp.]|uniref:SDR family NAD(P)-dependent oxidoreductase n=1 Tax=Sphingomonas sp. TaxID=28214 RepID=UPI003F703C02
MTAGERFDLSGRTALVTGGSRGLGREMALAFARAGTDVAVSSRKLDACEAVATEIRVLGRRSLALVAHAGDWAQLDALVERVHGEWGRIDILVNNAGMSPVQPSSAATEEALFAKVLAVNFKGPFRLAAQVARRMAQGDGGSIINISSLGAISPLPGIIPYAGAKAALNAMTIGMAKEFAPKVRVNTISPGMFATDIAQHWSDPEALLRRIPMGRFGSPSEIVGAALYLASDASSYTTGANIAIGGGIDSPR